MNKDLFNYFICYTDNVRYDENEIDYDGLFNLISIAKNKGDELVIHGKSSFSSTNNGCEPIKSGVIAIIYKATLNGKQVIIKYRRKNIVEKFEKSMNEHMNKVVDAQRSILEKELSSGSWLARNWRPILMAVFTLMIVLNFLFVPGLELFRTVFDLNFWIPQPQDIPEKVWTLLQIGLGGYILGRSGEKIADKLKK